MIRALRVRNLVTIDALELELGPGLTVVTGETGAGKSLLLGAIALLSGQRVGSELVRAGAREAEVEAIFASPELVGRARGLGLAGDGEEELLVSRSVSREGRGRVSVNGRLATVALLAELMTDALEITSQGEHQRLLRNEAQAELLDAFAGLGPSAQEIAELHRGWRELALAIQARRRDREALARREDQLRFELAQIDGAKLEPGELDSLGVELRRLGYADRLAQAASRALELLDGEDGARERLAGARATLRGVSELDPALGPPAEALERARLELEEASFQLERYAASIDADPQRLARVEDRLAELRRLQSRYGATVEDILAHRARESTRLWSSSAPSPRSCPGSSSGARASRWSSCRSSRSPRTVSHRPAGLPDASARSSRSRRIRARRAAGCATLPRAASSRGCFWRCATPCARRTPDACCCSTRSTRDWAARPPAGWENACAHLPVAIK